VATTPATNPITSPDLALASGPTTAGVTSAGTEVAILGAGVIGMSCAWRLSLRGLSVTVVDPTPTAGASWAAAGMLAPVTEASYGETALLQIGLASAAKWPSYAAELADAAGRDPGLRQTDTLVVAHDSGDKAELDRFAAYAHSLGLSVQGLTSRECRQLEPMLAPDIRGGLLAPDQSVHNRDLLAALTAACERAGVQFVRQSGAIRVRDERCVGVDLTDGTTITADSTVLAAGAWSALIAGLPSEVVPPIRPVRGVILRLGTPPDYQRLGGVLSRTLRGTVSGAHVYLVPRADGEIVVGATSDEVGYDDRVTAGGVWELLRDARLLLPVTSELTFTEAWSGLRPVTPDNAPLVGASGLPGLILATGHGRNGVLLSPITAEAITALIADEIVQPELTTLSPQRFPHHEPVPRPARPDNMVAKSVS
jgi:glycine oxidase